MTLIKFQVFDKVFSLASVLRAQQWPGRVPDGSLETDLKTCGSRSCKGLRRWLHHTVLRAKGAGQQVDGQG